MANAQQDVTFVVWNDCRELLAALKAQRWSVAQWVVTVNLALSAAAAADVLKTSHVTGLFAAFEFGVTALGAFLVWHYNERMAKVRARLRAVVGYVGDNLFDFNKEIGLDVGKQKGRDYDRQELIVFYSAIGGSLLPIVVLLAIR